MISRFAIFQKRFTALGSDEAVHDYVAIPIDHLYTGIYIPASHPDIDPSELAQLDATDTLDAVARYRESLQDSFM